MAQLTLNTPTLTDPSMRVVPCETSLSEISLLFPCHQRFTHSCHQGDCSSNKGFVRISKQGLRVVCIYAAMHFTPNASCKCMQKTNQSRPMSMQASQRAVFDDVMQAVRLCDGRSRCREAVAGLVKAAEKAFPHQKRWPCCTSWEQPTGRCLFIYLC